MNHEIEVENLKEGDAVCHSVILMRGRICNSGSCKNLIDILEVRNGNAVVKSVDRFKNDFKCVTLLKPGDNTIRLKYCCSESMLNVKYVPRETEYVVVPVYVLCKNHDGRFQADEGEDDSPESALLRIATGMKLLQCLIAEKFIENGLERKTFQLESDSDPTKVGCRTFVSDLDTNSARKMNQEELWTSIGRELMKSATANEKHKYVAFISCTRYRGDEYEKSSVRTFEQIVAITEAHAALGGGGLAVFGSACLHTWPTDVDRVTSCFLDKARIDRRKLMDDSNYRGTRGGCFASTLGAVCHELGHVFDLGHAKHGIMGQEFFRIDKAFTVERRNRAEHSTVEFEAGSVCGKPCVTTSKNKKTDNWVVTDNVYWSDNNLKWLYHHKWFNSTRPPSRLCITEDRKVVSDVDILFIELRHRSSGMPIRWWDFSSNPVLEFAIPETTNVCCVAQDRNGSAAKREF